MANTKNMEQQAQEHIHAATEKFSKLHSQGVEALSQQSNLFFKAFQENAEQAQEYFMKTLHFWQNPQKNGAEFLEYQQEVAKKSIERNCQYGKELQKQYAQYLSI